EIIEETPRTFSRRAGLVSSPWLSDLRKNHQLCPTTSHCTHAEGWRTCDKTAVLLSQPHGCVRNIRKIRNNAPRPEFRGYCGFSGQVDERSEGENRAEHACSTSRQ